MLWTHTSFSSSSPCGWSDFSCQTSTSKVVAFGPTRIWVFPRTWVLPGFMEPVLEIPWHPSSQSLTSEPKMTQMNKTVAPSAPEKKPRGGKRGVETLRVKIRLVGGLILEVLVAFRIGLFLGTCWNSTVKSWRNPTVGAWRHWYGPRMWRFLLNKSEVKVWVTGLVAMPLPWEWSWDFITKMVFFPKRWPKKEVIKKNASQTNLVHVCNGLYPLALPLVSPEAMTRTERSSENGGGWCTTWNCLKHVAIKQINILLNRWNI